MKKPTVQRKQQPKAAPSTAWRTIPLMLVCLLLFVGGFFLAGRQHFSSMDYGIKNSRLRKQIEDLESEKRRLILAREMSLAPTEIKKAARKAGLVELGDAAAIAQLASHSAPTPTSPLATAAAQPAANPLVVRTAAVAPVSTPTAAAVAKVNKSEKPASRPVEAPAKQLKKTTAAAE